MTFDEALGMLYAPNNSGGRGRRDLYKDRIQKMNQTIDVKRIVFTYIKDPFGNDNHPSLILFTLNELIQVQFTDGKLRMLFLPLTEIEQIIFEDDLKDNVRLELKFKSSDSVRFTSDDGHVNYKLTYSMEIYKVLKLVQG